MNYVHVMAEPADRVCVCVCLRVVCVFFPSVGNLRGWDTWAFHVASLWNIHDELTTLILWYLPFIYVPLTITAAKYICQWHGWVSWMIRRRRASEGGDAGIRLLYKLWGHFRRLPCRLIHPTLFFWLKPVFFASSPAFSCNLEIC